MEKMLEDHKKKLIRKLKQKAKNITEDDLKVLLKKASNKKMVVAKLLKAGDTMEKRMKKIWPFIKDYASGKFAEAEWKSIAITVAGFSFLIDSSYIKIEELPVINEFDDAIVIALILKVIKKDLDAYLTQKKVAT